jgi:uncharacterized cupin superfamily protein
MIHRDDVTARETHEGDIHFVRRMLAAAAGARRIGCSQYVVAAGRRQMPVHVHGDEEESFYVLGGGGLSWQRGAACEVRAGDVVVHPPRAHPHTFLAGNQGLELLAFSSGSDTSITYLPRAKVMWCGPRWVPVDAPHPFVAEAAAGELERPEPGDRTANVVSLDDVHATSFPGSRVRAVGAAAGSARAGLNHVALEPGQGGAPPHCHTLEEELFYVLEGSGTLRHGDAAHPLQPGDVVARPASTAVAHSLMAGDEGLTYLVYGTREPGDSVYYPQAGQVRLRGLGVTLDLPGRS